MQYSTDVSVLNNFHASCVHLPIGKLRRNYSHVSILHFLYLC